MPDNFNAYFKSLRKYIDFNVRLLIFSSIIGAYFALNSTDNTQKVINWASDSLSPGVELSGVGLFIFIFQNNVTALFYALLESIVFGLSSIGLIAVNGIIIGVFFILISEKISLAYFIAGIIPHGIFEIPAAIISASMGLKIGVSVVQRARGKSASVLSEIFSALKYFILIVVPLLFVAALVETFVTPVILSYFV